MVESVSLWHITPVDIGVEFFDPTNSVITNDAELYRIANDEYLQIEKNKYNKEDYRAIIKMRRFLSEVNENLQPPARFIDKFPGISGCIAKYQISENLFCYIMVSGIAVFYEKGDDIPFEDANYFSIPAFYERQIYEDDYCTNSEVSVRKRAVYSFIDLLWKCVGQKQFSFSSSEEYGNHGILYCLCITAINAPHLVSNNVDLQLRKNIYALIETSAFNNVTNRNHWEIIKRRIDCDPIDDLKLLELSDDLVFADNWSGVVLAGNLSDNDTCIKWFLEFEIYLQSQWYLFSSYCENVARLNMSAMELQGILNRVEYIKVTLDNDISSNMEQIRHAMRNSLIASSDINTIYHRMHGLVSNKLKMKIMSDEKKKSRYSLFSDLALLVIALLEIYGVVGELLSQTSYTKNDLLTLIIMLAVTVVCGWAMIKGRG